MTMSASTQLTTPVTNRDHIRGIDSAAVTLVEYGDYACPHCNEARFVVKRLRTALGDRLRHVFRNFLTLTSYSSAHRAASCLAGPGLRSAFG
jgi:protein-disulfide isomerase